MTRSRSKSQRNANKLSVAFILAASCSAFLSASATLAPGLLQWCGINGHYSTLACTASTSCTVWEGCRGAARCMLHHALPSRMALRVRLPPHQKGLLLPAMQSCSGIVAPVASTEFHWPGERMLRSVLPAHVCPLPSPYASPPLRRRINGGQPATSPPVTPVSSL